MTDSTVSQAIDAKVAARAMLSHPFYQAWTEGRLSLETLRSYARQYFHHVEAFPRAVSAVHSVCPDRDGRRMLAENLAEEEGVEADRSRKSRAASGEQRQGDRPDVERVGVVEALSDELADEVAAGTDALTVGDAVGHGVEDEASHQVARLRDDDAAG